MIYNKIIESSLDLEEIYSCGYNSCPWKRYQYGEEYGYYNDTENDCLNCQEKCNTDGINCGGVECGGNHCSWWKTGVCTTDVEKVISTAGTGVYTCIKEYDTNNGIHNS